MSTFPLIHQPDAMDCGPACLGMIAKHYGEEKATQTADGILHYSSQIPESAMKKQLQFTEIQLHPSVALPLPIRFQIENISDVVQLIGKNAWQIAVLRPVEKLEKHVLLQNSVNVPGRILLEKQSVMTWVMRR